MAHDSRIPLSAACRYDVLFMTEPLDELTVQAIGEFGGKPLTDLGKENVDFAGDEEEKAKKEEQSTDTQGEEREKRGVGLALSLSSFLCIARCLCCVRDRVQVMITVTEVSANRP